MIAHVENILFADKDDFESVKIGDFGLCTKYQIAFSDNYLMSGLTSRVGTFLYMAPEIIHKKQYTTVFYIILIDIRK